jgi:hypothetical protein
VRTEIWLGSLKGKRPLEKPRSRWEDNIMLCYGNKMKRVDWIRMAQGIDR